MSAITLFVQSMTLDTFPFVFSFTDSLLLSHCLNVHEQSTMTREEREPGTTVSQWGSQHVGTVKEACKVHHHHPFSSKINSIKQKRWCSDRFSQNGLSDNSDLLVSFPVVNCCQKGLMVEESIDTCVGL